MPEPRDWTCPDCLTRHEPPPEFYCPQCHTPRFASWAIAVAHHILEHLQDGLSQPLEILEAMQARPGYARTRLELHFIAQQMRLLTKDTTTLARQLAKARSAKTMLEVLETGDNNHKLRVLEKWGPETNAEHVDHSGTVSTTVKHVYEDLPKRDG